MYPPQWIGKGSFCTRRIENSCTSSTDNWLVTQYISKSADVSYELEITVDITGDADSTNAIKVYYYPSDGAITSGEQLNANNYNLIGSPSFGAATQKKSLTFSLGGQYDRFYIAIVEDNSCFTLRRLQVSYSQCLTETVGLVVYPNTPIGTGAVTISASCKANAEGSPSSSLSITCNTNGTYSGSPSCSCKGGYFSSGEACFGEIIQYLVYNNINFVLVPMYMQ